MEKLRTWTIVWYQIYCVEPDFLASVGIILPIYLLIYNRYFIKIIFASSISVHLFYKIILQ